MEATYETLLVDIFIGLQLYVLQNARGTKIMAKWIDGEKLMEYWQEWDWWDKKGMPHCFGYIPDKIVEREMERAPELKQVIHGYWIETEDLAGNHYINCSICNYDFWLEGESAEQAELFYCPRCGARMDGEKE